MNDLLTDLSDSNLECGSGYLSETLLKDVPLRDHGIYSNLVEVAGDRDQPFSNEFFEGAIRQAVGVEADAPIPGFSRFSPKLRDIQLADLFQADEGNTDRHKLD